ncbi:MAG: DUF3108 domain-containing protein [Devosia sp.]
MLRAGFRRVLGLAATGLAMCSPAAAEPARSRAEYTVTMGGTQIAVVNILFNDTGSQYTLQLDARIAGMAQFVASGSARATSSGVSNPFGLTAQKFDLMTRAQGEEFTSSVTYANGTVDTFQVVPPIVNTIDRIPIERKDLTRATDMMAPFVLRGAALDRSLCSGQMPIFTGVERFNLSLKYIKDDTATSKRTGYQGPVVLCSLQYKPISGHYTTSEITSYLENNERMLVWFAPLKQPGYFIPYRALVTTEAGDLSVVLTDLEE